MNVDVNNAPRVVGLLNGQPSSPCHENQNSQREKLPLNIWLCCWHNRDSLLESKFSAWQSLCRIWSTTGIHDKGFKLKKWIPVYKTASVSKMLSAAGCENRAVKVLHLLTGSLAPTTMFYQQQVVKSSSTDGNKYSYVFWFKVLGLHCQHFHFNDRYFIFTSWDYL